MYRKEVVEEDLRAEIFSLRKHIAGVCSENQILKVKIRRLQDEMITRDKQLDEFLNSKRIFGFSKDLQEKGASVLLNLKLKNDKLEQTLLDKDIMIKRLQNTVQTAKLYNVNSLSKKFISKGVACTLITDNKSECQNKGKLNTKIELRMPNFDIDRLEEMRENWKSEDDLTVSGMNLNSVKSQLLLDINNYDVKKNIEYYSEAKQKTAPSYYSEARYESKGASYQLDRGESRSSYTIEHREMSTNNLHIGQSAEEDFTTSDQYRRPQKNIRDRGRLNSSFRMIARSVEKLMSQDNIGEKIDKKVSEDKAVQFPSDRAAIVQSADSAPSYDKNTEVDDSLMDLIHSTKFRREIEIFENRFPPTTSTEMQAQDQSDLEAASISEKTDKMEKTEIHSNEQEKEIVDSDAPHEEIKQLHCHLMAMISQVDNLKSTISKMKLDQQKTENDLKSKDENIEKLAKEIEQLREIRTLSLMGINKFSNTAEINMEPAEKDTDEIIICESLQKATETNLKKIVGKIKDLKASRSKASIQTAEKTTKTSSKRNKSEKRKNVEKSDQKYSEKNTLKTSEPKNVFGIGSGDVVEVPFFRYGFGQTSYASEKSFKNEFDELD